MSTYYFLPTRNVFGEGAVNEAGALLGSLHVSHAMIVTDKFLAQSGMADRVSQILADSGIQSVIFDGAEPNPTDKNVEAGVAFFRGDLFEAVTGRQMYDCIVSNPPYIRTEVIETLSEEVRAHEPYQALDGKEDGLYFYREIVRKSGSYLKPGGHLLFEIGYDQAEAVSMLMQTRGYEEIEVIRDLAGLDRVVKGKRKQEELHV